MAIAATLATVSFTISYAIALRLLDLRVYENSDVWFEADSNFFLAEFAHVPIIDARHPTLSLIVYNVVSVVSRGIIGLGFSSATAAELRVWLSVLVAPVLSAARTLLLFGVFQRVIGRLGPTVMLVVLDMTASATVILGGIPESYGVTATCLAAMYWLLLDDAPRRREVRTAQWLLLGTAAVGVTLTNVMPLWILLLATLRRRGVAMRRAVAGAVVGAVGSTLLTTAIAYEGSRYFSTPELSGRSFEITQSVLHPVNAVDIEELSRALGQVFVAPAPRRSHNRVTRRDNADYDFIFWYRGPPPKYAGSLWRVMLTAGVLLLGTAALIRRRASASIAIAALGVILCNVLLHLIWGWHYWVYGLHWVASLLVLMSGLALWTGPRRVVGDLILAGLLLVTLANSWLQLHALLAQLATA